MTREEAIKVLQRMKYPYKCNKRKMIISNVDRDNEALDMAISALSQEPICDRDCEHCTWTECPIEPCDDAISREDAIKALQNVICESMAIKSRMVGAIEGLPSVTQKSGKWINDECGNVICSECKRFRRDCRYGHTNYCNHCGAKMESEDK